MGRHLVLAGGGHSHALVLRLWAMQPHRRPAGLITLVSRHSTALYSGMVPGLVAGLYQRDDLAIDLRRLADQAGVSLVIAEITGVELSRSELQLSNRPPLWFDRLSLNVGAVTTAPNAEPANAGLAIKPLEPALQALEQATNPKNQAEPFQVVGSGLAAIELSMALRQRWPQRSIQLLARSGRIPSTFEQTLRTMGVQLISAPGESSPQINGANPHLRCTGSCAPHWLMGSGFPVDKHGRVRTAATLEVLGHPGIFAAGDCAVIDRNPRPASGVWAVRAAKALAHNLQASGQGRPLRSWRPQRWALQLLGGFQRHGEPTAWALWGPFSIGPHPWLWRWKQHIDRQFMARFAQRTMANAGDPGDNAMLCRGCAAKLPADCLEAALTEAGLARLGCAPEDAAVVPNTKGRSEQPLLQSVDGFPALLSDPWLNGRLTALHASSDLWACGSQVDSAQALITLPLVEASLQRELLKQTLAGIRSVLDPQGAQLIGGHTLESRSPSPLPCSLGIQVALSVQGLPKGAIWRKRGIQSNDRLLLSKPLGTGVLFAAAMAGACPAHALDQALVAMSTSQHSRVEQLRALEHQYPGQIHAATDITGFGLLGHLGEMLGIHADERLSVQIDLNAEAIPALPEALELLSQGWASSLAPSNRKAWSLLDASTNQSVAPVQLKLGDVKAGSTRHGALLDLLVDPQTCGPLLISVSPALAEELMQQDPRAWWPIGTATPR